MCVLFGERAFLIASSFLRGREGGAKESRFQLSSGVTNEIIRVVILTFGPGKHLVLRSTGENVNLTTVGLDLLS